MTQTTRDKLILSAAFLFQERGYNGVGVADILDAAGVPKGSLYHHFKNGKADLALEAAAWTSAQMQRIIDDAFRDAADFEDGLTTLFYKLAKLFDLQPAWRACPIAASLFDGPGNSAFREEAARIFEGWRASMAEHCVRLGMDAAVASAQSQIALISIQGAWTTAYSQNSSRVLKELPGLLYPSTSNAQSS